MSVEVLKSNESIIPEKLKHALLGAFALWGVSGMEAVAQEAKVNLPKQPKIEITIANPNDLCGVVNTALCEASCARQRLQGQNSQVCDDACVKFVSQCRESKKPDGSQTYESGFFKITIPPAGKAKTAQN